MKFWLTIVLVALLILPACEMDDNLSSSEILSNYERVEFLASDKSKGNFMFLTYANGKNQILVFNENMGREAGDINLKSDNALIPVFSDTVGEKLFMLDYDIDTSSKDMFCYSFNGDVLWTRSDVQFPSVVPLHDGAGYVFCDASPDDMSTFSVLSSTFQEVTQFTVNSLYSPQLLINDDHGTLFYASTEPIDSPDYYLSFCLAKIDMDGNISTGEMLASHPQKIFTYQDDLYFIGGKLSEDGLSAGSATLYRINEDLNAEEVATFLDGEKTFWLTDAVAEDDNIYIVGAILDVDQNVEKLLMLKANYFGEIVEKAEFNCDTYFNYLFASFGEDSFVIYGFENNVLIEYKYRLG